MSFRNFAHKFNKYFWFDKTELNGFLITVFVLAFILSFTDWGVEKFDAIEGFSNLFLAVIVIAISVFIHHAAQRLLALYYGFRAEHILWWQGLAFAGLFAIFSNGKIKFLPGSALMIHHMPIHRLGFYRYGPKFSTFGTIALTGPLANLVFAVLVRIVGDTIFPGYVFFYNLYYFNLVFAAYNFLPFPPLDGSRVMYESRLVYVFIFTAVVSYILLALLAGITGLLGAILSLIAAFICWIVFYIFFEREWS